MLQIIGLCIAVAGFSIAMSTMSMCLYIIKWRNKQ